MQAIREVHGIGDFFPGLFLRLNILCVSCLKIISDDLKIMMLRELFKRRIAVQGGK